MIADNIELDLLSYRMIYQHEEAVLAKENRANNHPKELLVSAQELNFTQLHREYDSSSEPLREDYEAAQVSDNLCERTAHLSKS